MPDLLLKVGSIVLLLGGLIFVHELGHFLVAKPLGVKVLRFSIGFGPRLFGFHRGETEYRISLLPARRLREDGRRRPERGDSRRRIAAAGSSSSRPGGGFAHRVRRPGDEPRLPGAHLLRAVRSAQNGEPAAGAVVGTVPPGLAGGGGGASRPATASSSVDRAGRAGAAGPLLRRPARARLAAPRRAAHLPRASATAQRAAADHDRARRASEESNPVETHERGVIGVTPTYPPAARRAGAPGAAGALEPFDLVVAAGGEPVRHLGRPRARRRGARAAAPLDLEVAARAPARAARRDARRVRAGHARAACRPAPAGRATSCPPTLASRPSSRRSRRAARPTQAGLRRGDAIAAVNGSRCAGFRDLNALGREFADRQAGRSSRSRDGRRVDARAGRGDLRRRASRRSSSERMRARLLPRAAPRARRSRARSSRRVPLARGVGEAAVARRGASSSRRGAAHGARHRSAIVTGDISFKTVGGPIMLFSDRRARRRRRAGDVFLFKMALISVNLGLMNLLPIPVLDGGHIAQASSRG